MFISQSNIGSLDGFPLNVLKLLGAFFESLEDAKATLSIKLMQVCVLVDTSSLCQSDCYAVCSGTWQFVVDLGLFGLCNPFNSCHYRN